MKRLFVLFLYFFWSCSSPSHWQLDAITAGDKQFNAACLKYSTPSTISPLRFELARVGDHLEAYVNLVRYHFASSENSFVKISFTFNEEQKEVSIPLLEGSMRLHLPFEITKQIIEALQKGEKVGILVDDFEQILLPELFSKLYEKLMGSTIFLQNPIKGPLQ